MKEWIRQLPMTENLIKETVLIFYKKYWSDDDARTQRKIDAFYVVNYCFKRANIWQQKLGNKVNNANPHWFSYPGYSEIMTGYADPALIQMTMDRILMLPYWNF